jgi:hypothetical protein
LSGGLFAALVVVLLGYLAYSSPLPVDVAGKTTALPRAAPALQPCVMDRSGTLRGRVFGSLELDVDLQGSALACDGGPRPEGKGLRLFFAGAPGAGPGGIVLVIGIDGTLDSLKGKERPASITLNDESSHRFFHADAGRCFTRVNDVAPLPGAPGRKFRIDGVAWCVGALPSVVDEASVTLGDFSYSGRVSLDAE